MPGKVKVKVVAGRSLPIMDRSNDTTDAFVEVKLGQVTHKTDVCRKSLNPQWNSEWFRFEMDDLELQDEPLQIRLMDYDTYSANDAIGKVYLDLNPLLINSSKGKDNWGKIISGWIPVYDTMHGIRGEVNLIVKVELFSDLNKYRQSSCGVRFFFTQSVPEGYVAHTIQGFVEELVVNDDPEYQWIDKIRTPRASNEARQTLFSKLSGEVQRRVGLKALELGGNAVIGYKQCLDLEGESGIVFRGIGTAIFLTRLYDNQLSPTCLIDPGIRESLESSGNIIPNRILRKQSPRLKRSFRVPSATLLSMLTSATSTNNDNTHLSHRSRLLGPSSGSVDLNITTGGGGGGGKNSRSHLKPSLSNVSSKDHARSFSSLMRPRAVGSSHSGGSSPGLVSVSTTSARSNAAAGSNPNRFKQLRQNVSQISASTPSVPASLTTGSTLLPLFCKSTSVKVKMEVEAVDTIVHLKAEEENPGPLLLSSPPEPQPLPPDSDSIRINTQIDLDISCTVETDTNTKTNSDFEHFEHSPDFVSKSCKKPNTSTSFRSRTINKQLSSNSLSLSLRNRIRNRSSPSSSHGEGSKLESRYAGVTSDSDISYAKKSINTAVDFVLRRSKTPTGPGPSVTFKMKDSAPKSSPTSPTSPTNSLSRFVILRRRRGSRKKDKFSTNCLIKRAGNQSDLQPASSHPTKDRLKEEFSKILKRMSLSDDTKEKSTKPKLQKVKSLKKPVYREPRKFFFRKRRRTASGNYKDRDRYGLDLEGDISPPMGRKLTRSTSESQSLGQTSFESLPSIGSEPVFSVDEDDDSSDQNCSSLIEIPTFFKTPEHGLKKTKTSEELKNLGYPKSKDDSSSSSCFDHSSRRRLERPEGVQVDHSKLKELIQGLGYDVAKPLKLYISSMDALLVYNPHPLASVELERCDKAQYINLLGYSNTNTTGSSGNDTYNLENLENLDSLGLEHLELGIDSAIVNLDTLDSDSDLENLFQFCTNRRSDESDKDITHGSHSHPRRIRQDTLRADAPDESSSSTTTTTNTSRSNTDSSQSSFSSRAVLELVDKRRHQYKRTHGGHGGRGSSRDRDRDRFCDDVTTDDDENESEVGVEKVHDFGLMTGCRSPIPEEFFEPGPIATTTTTSTTNSLAVAVNPCPQTNIPTSNPPYQISPNKESQNQPENQQQNGFIQNDSVKNSTNSNLTKIANKENVSSVHNVSGHSNSSGSPDNKDNPKLGNSTANAATTSGNQNQYTPAHSIGNMNRRSSESDLSTPPKGGGGGSAVSSHSKGQLGIQRSGINFDNLEMLEFPFITIALFPPGFIYYLGGTVTARSVKLLDRITNFDEPESRDAWWNEIRMEMRSHCRAFGCTVLLGYEEHTTMCDDVCILSASGTAAVVISGNLDLLDVNLPKYEGFGGNSNSKDRRAESLAGGGPSGQPTNGLKMMPLSPKSRHDSDGSYDPCCSMLHIPHSVTCMPTSVKKTRCAFCRKGRVPDVLLSTIEIPTGLQTTGRSCLIQAQVFRPKKDVKGEISAKELSDSLPFLEYELHRRLINKLKIKGMNAIFGLQVQICLGEKLMVGIATGTAVYLTGLPTPTVPVICAGNLKTDAQKVQQFQKVVQETFEKNREIFGVKNVDVPSQHQGSTTSSDVDSDDELQDELLHRNKDTFVLEVDDAEDIDIITMLIDPNPSVGYNMNNIEGLLGFDDQRVVSQQMFNQIWRCRIPSLSLRQFTTYFDRLIRSVTFKLRRMQRCVLSKLQFRIDLPEQDEMQLSIIGMAVGLENNNKTFAAAVAEGIQASSKMHSGGVNTKGEDGELIFAPDDEKGLVSSGGGVGAGGEEIPGMNGGSGNANGNSVPVGKSIAVVTNPVGNVNVSSSSCISVVSSCSSGNGGTSGSDSSGNTSSIYSVRHPQSRSAKCITLMMVGANKPMPAPVSRMRHWVEITPLSYIHGSRIERYLGNLNFFFIRETTSLRENGGLNGFVHNFLTEVLAIVRAHVAALGGNAMVSYFMTECALLHNPHKNQSQCVVNVGGDAVLVSYPSGSHPEDGVS